MAIGNIAAYSFLVLSKLGLKVAEKKKWLPSGYYHKKSVHQLKDGNLEKAMDYNSIAIDKNPESEKALIMRDLISMQQESKAMKLQREIESTQERIQHNQAEITANKKLYKKEQQKYFLTHSLTFILFLPLLISAVLFLFFKVNSPLFSWFMISVCAINLIGFMIISRTILEDKRIDRSLKKSEFELMQKTLNQRLEENGISLQRLQIKSRIVSKEHNLTGPMNS